MIRSSEEEIRPGCRTADVRQGRVRGYALSQHSRFGAVWFRSGVSTPSGIRIGSTPAALVRAYGMRLRWKRHSYEHGSWYAFLTRRSRPRWQIRFDVSRQGRVFQIGFGGGAVTYDEGCA